MQTGMDEAVRLVVVRIIVIVRIVVALVPIPSTVRRVSGGWGVAISVTRHDRNK